MMLGTGRDPVGEGVMRTRRSKGSFLGLVKGRNVRHLETDVADVPRPWAKKIAKPR